MREIKFKAWNKENKCYDSYDNGHTTEMYCRTEAFVILQFIGLFDKNGEELYGGGDDGDLVKLHAHEYLSQPLIITYDPTMAAFGFLGTRGYRKGWISIERFLTYNSIGQIEKIGDSLKNPELLEANND